MHFWQDSHLAIASLPRLISIAGILKFIAGHVKPECGPPSCSIGPLLPESGVMTYFLMPLATFVHLTAAVHPPEPPFSRLGSTVCTINHVGHFKQITLLQCRFGCITELNSGGQVHPYRRALQLSVPPPGPAVRARWAVCCRDLSAEVKGETTKGYNAPAEGIGFFSW